ncbi:MAG TPA: alpha/beta family hydrolase [Mycobacteriales bacterium]|nr:alpha/beta family hydrolase [Mycobacteriales bacterium]
MNDKSRTTTATPEGDVLELPTLGGPARAHVSRPAPSAGTAGPRAGGLVVLGHGAGGGIDAPDLVAVSGALTATGWTVARVEQPYRVRGRRAPEPAPRLDAAWTEVVGQLRSRLPGPLVVGGRSSGARVACRTASVVGADAVLCLAFPLRPPRRPERSRAEELALVTVPLLVVQGERDPFGGPAEFPPGVRVAAVPGDHALRRTAPVVDAVTRWLAEQRWAGQRLA